jgi:DNA-binding NarL/FixJ family response regulator
MSRGAGCLFNDRMKLYSREAEAVSKLLLGKSDKEIAHEMGLVIGTVKVYLSHAYHILGVSGSRQLMARYYKGEL